MTLLSSMRIVPWGVIVLLSSACGSSAESDGGGSEVEGASATCERDADCDDSVFCNGVESCIIEDDGVGTCQEGESPCGAAEECIETPASCAPSCSEERDADGDGFDSVACGGDDCDDTDPNRYPGNTEVCDELGHDEDCDPNTLGRDLDRDGHIDDRCCNEQPDGELRCGDDCDDLRDSVNPTAIDACNDIDDDCDGDVDEDPQLILYVDADGDGFGLPGEPDDKSIPKKRRPIRSCTLEPGYSFLGTDCNDEEATAHPGASEICDANDVDEDCDGESEEYGAGVETPAVNPSAFYLDEDGDGFGVTGNLILGCDPVGPYRALLPGDCRDDRHNVWPGNDVPQAAPDCLMEWVAGDLAYDLSPTDCGDHWECIPRHASCGYFDHVSPRPPELDPVWDYNCSGELEKRTRPGACIWDGASCVTFFDPIEFYTDAECGKTDVYTSYSCEGHATEGECNGHGPVESGPIIKASCF